MQRDPGVAVHRNPPRCAPKSPQLSHTEPHVCVHPISAQPTPVSCLSCPFLSRDPHGRMPLPTAGSPSQNPHPGVPPSTAPWQDPYPRVPIPNLPSQDPHFRIPLPTAGSLFQAPISGPSPHFRIPLPISGSTSPVQDPLPHFRIPLPILGSPSSRQDPYSRSSCRGSHFITASPFQDPRPHVPTPPSAPVAPLQDPPPFPPAGPHSAHEAAAFRWWRRRSRPCWDDENQESFPRGQGGAPRTLGPPGRALGRARREMRAPTRDPGSAGPPPHFPVGFGGLGALTVPTAVPLPGCGGRQQGAGV